MSKKSEDKWIHVGSYELGIEKNSIGSVLVCRSIAKNWSVRWRDDTMMFGMMLSIARNENAREYLHSLLTVMFVVTTYPHDLVALTEKNEMPFMQGVADLLHNQNEYESSMRPQPTEEENQQAIEEMRRIAEVESELAEIVKEENEEESDGEEVQHEGV